MICNKCGANCVDGAMFCNSCGNALQTPQPQPQAQQPQQPVYQQPVYQQPVYQQPVYQQPVYQQQYQQPVYQQKPPYQPPVYKTLNVDASGMLTKYSHIFSLILAAVALIAGILTATTLLWGESFSFMAELDGGWMLWIAIILYGLLSLLAAGVGVLYVLKKFANQPLYDQLVGKLIKLEDPTFVIGAIGFVASLILIVLFALAGLIASDFEAFYSTHWVNELATWIYSVVGVANFVAQAKKK